MSCTKLVSATAILTAGLLASACSGASEPVAAPSESSTAGTTSAAAAPTSSASANGELESLIPTPASSARVDGPDPIQENGIQKHFLVTAPPLDAMDAYKMQLEGEGWTLTAGDSGGGNGGGGAYYSGTKGEAFGVFTGGGYENTTDIRSCVWASKPADPSCTRI